VIPPCPSPDAIVARALSQVGRGMYLLGAGDTLDPDSPFEHECWRDAAGVYHEGSCCDCSRFALWCVQMPAVIPGFNHGPHATIADDLNSDSILGDATFGSLAQRFAMIDGPVFDGDHYEWIADRPEPGDLVAYRSIWFADGEANDVGRGERRWIGHVGVVVDVPDAWTPGAFTSLGVVQCQAGSAPAVQRTDGAFWAHHTASWFDGGKFPLRRACVVRRRA
jgi:hypothetical protein